MTVSTNILNLRKSVRASLGLPGLIAALAVIVPMNSALFAQDSFPSTYPTIQYDDAFDETFEKFDVLPPAAEPALHVVDITVIKPPVEVVPEPQPEADVRRNLGTGVASYYGKRFAGRKTANGERFNPRYMTAAHKTLPFGSKVRVTNPRNGKFVIVRINDRGPYAHGRTIDLSRAAAKKIGLVKRGHGKVEMALLH